MDQLTEPSQINLFGDTPTPVKKVKEDKRNPQVTAVIDTLKTSLNLRMLDGTQEKNRQFAYLLIRKFGFETTMKIIEATSKNRWWCGRVTSTMKLYYNAVAIMSDATGRSYGVNKVSITTTEF